MWEKSVYDGNVGYYIKSQVWEYKLVGSLQPGKEFTQYVIIADYGTGWLLVHILWDEEAAQLLQEISETPVPEEPAT